MEFGKIAIWILEMMEFVLGVCILIPEMFDGNIRRKEKIAFWLPTLIAAGVYAYNGTLSWIALPGAIVFSLFMMLLFVFHRKYIFHVGIWMHFFLASVMLLKLPFLLAVGYEKGQNIILINKKLPDGLALTGEGVCVGLLAGIFFAFRKKKCKISSLSKWFWWELLLVGILEVMVIHFITDSCTQTIEFTYLIINLCFIVIFILLIAVVIILYILQQTQIQKKTLKMVADIQRKYKAELQSQYEDMAKRNHDIRTERSYLYHRLSENSVEAALSFLQEKMDMVPGNTGIWTGVKFLDFMITIKKTEMDKRKIRFQLYSDYQTLNIGEDDFGIIFGNLLDNAIEAAERCEEDSRWVRIELIEKASIFGLKVCNSCRKSYNRSERLLYKSTKSGTGHGFGLRIVEELTDKWGGTIQYDFMENECCVMVLFRSGGNI